jgi:hypothetical protein
MCHLGMSMDWTQIKAFKGIDLNDSFILSWKVSSNNLAFEVEASIWPESIYYQEPVADEYTCYKQASLVFENTEKITGLLNQESVKPTEDPDGSLDYGNIETLIVNVPSALHPTTATVSMLSE